MLSVRSVSGEGGYLEDSAVITAANLALKRLFSDVDMTGRASVWLQAPRVERSISEFRHDPRCAESLPLVGAAYSFRVFGRGRALITDGAVTKTLEFDGYGIAERGFIKSGGEIRFEGELAYTVKGFALFSELLGCEVEDIPLLGEARRLSLSGRVSDFSSAAGVPTDKNGKALPSVYLEDGALIAPPEFTGEVFFTYKKKPPALSLDDSNKDIALPSGMESALVCLTAAYLLVAAESEAASFFTEEYRLAVSELQRAHASSRSAKYTDTTGWA